MRLHILSAFLALASSTFAGNWPAWRGPAADGTTPETDLPLHFSATEGVKWKVPLPERGNSTPIVWGQKIFLTQNVGTRRTLMCLDRKDGHTLWQAGPEWTGEDITHGTNPYCSSSPATDGERVVAWFGSAGLWCWDLDGKEQWHVDLGPQKHIWGYAASPVLHGDLCILNFGPGERSFIVAVNKKTGKEVWRFNVPKPVKKDAAEDSAQKAPTGRLELSQRPTVMEGPGSGQGYAGSWNTGLVVHGTNFLISLPGALYSLDTNTGKEQWHCNGLNPVTYCEPISWEPVGTTINHLTLGDGCIVAAFGGYGGYSIGVSPGADNNKARASLLWQEKKNPQRIGSGVSNFPHKLPHELTSGDNAEGFAWLVGEPGIIQCIELATGKELWKERMQTPAGRANTWSSLVLSGDRIYAVTQNSDVIVFKASTEKYEQLAVNSLGDGLTNSSLAVSDGQLFLRTHKHLWCIGK